MKTPFFNQFQSILEKQLFGVCSNIADKLGLKSSRVRLYFIYLSFLTFGSPIIIYLVLAFIMENRNFWVKKRRSIWDL